MTDDKKPREFWIFERRFNNPISQVFKVKQEGFMYPDQIHVIEHSAYAALLHQHEGLKATHVKRLAELGEQITRTQQLEAKYQKAVAALKYIKKSPAASVFLQTHARTTLRELGEVPNESSDAV